MECAECIDAPAGAPPCLFCSFAQPRNFYGIINTALNISECKYCDVDGRRVCGICFAYRGASRTGALPPVTLRTLLASHPEPTSRHYLHPAGVVSLSKLCGPYNAAPSDRRNYSHALMISPSDDDRYPGTMASGGRRGRGYSSSQSDHSSGYFIAAGAAGPNINASSSRATTTVMVRQTPSDTLAATAVSATMGQANHQSDFEASQHQSSHHHHHHHPRRRINIMCSPPLATTYDSLTTSSQSRHSLKSLDRAQSHRTRSVEAFDKNNVICQDDDDKITAYRHNQMTSRVMQCHSFNKAPHGSSAVLSRREPAANPDDGRFRRWCLCGRSSQPTFRLPGEPQSFARLCANCPSKPLLALSDDVAVSKRTSMPLKRRRVGDATEPFDNNDNVVGLPRWETASSSAARPRGVNSPGEPANKAVVGVKRNKRSCLCGASLPTFGLPGEPASAARWCSNCPDKPPHAINTKNKRCLCGSSQPSFGLPGGNPTVARWCSKCPDKPANAVDVKHKRCMCNTSIPNFGLPGEPAAAARWCSKCPEKPSNAIDVKNKKCQCGNSQPSLGLPGDPPTAARWCSKCPQKPSNAVGVKSKRCKCGLSQPSFGLPGERATLARWCYKCPDKAPNAVNLKSKKCRCGSSVPSFGLLGEPPSAARWCSKCPDKSPDAIDVKNYRRCVCRHGIPSFGLPGKEPIVLQWCSKCPGKPSSAVEIRTDDSQ